MNRLNIYNQIYSTEKALPSEGLVVGLRKTDRLRLKGTYRDNNQTLKHNYYVTIIVT